MGVKGVLLSMETESDPLDFLFAPAPVAAEGHVAFSVWPLQPFPVDGDLPPHAINRLWQTIVRSALFRESRHAALRSSPVSRERLATAKEVAVFEHPEMLLWHEPQPSGSPALVRVAGHASARRRVGRTSTSRTPPTWLR